MFHGGVGSVVILHVDIIGFNVFHDGIDVFYNPK